MNGSEKPQMIPATKKMTCLDEHVIGIHLYCFTRLSATACNREHPSENILAVFGVQILRWSIHWSVIIIESIYINPVC